MKRDVPENLAVMKTHLTKYSQTSFLNQDVSMTYQLKYILFGIISDFVSTIGCVVRYSRPHIISLTRAILVYLSPPIVLREMKKFAYCPTELFKRSLADQLAMPS